MRPGFVHNALVLVLASLAAVVILVLLLIWNPVASSTEKAESITVYCAAGIRKPVEEIAKAYEREYGVQVQLQYGSSGSLLSQIEVNPTGDLYIPGDDDFITPARQKNLVREMIPLARFSLVLAVAPGNPKNINGIDDLLREDVKLGIGNETTAIGRKTAALFARTGKAEALRATVKVVKPTVTEIAADIQVGAIDAGFIWDAVAKERQLTIVPLAEAADAEAMIPALVLTSSKQPAAALRFARYLAAPEKGQQVFAANHYEPLGVEPWAERPSITLFSGGVNRVAIEQTLAQFVEREGIDLNVVYNGCGTLVGMMKAGQKPDVYFACDVSFTHDVLNLFNAFEDVSSTPMVMLVRKGNPENIRTLADLARPGLRVGRADEQLSALGALTKRLLEAANLYDAVSANTRVTSPTADFLVNQLNASGQLDVVIVYEANCSYVRDSMEIVPIDHPLALAVQPIGMGRETRYPLIATRLIEAVQSDTSRQRFEAAGFSFLHPARPAETVAP